MKVKRYEVKQLIKDFYKIEQGLTLVSIYSTSKELTKFGKECLYSSIERKNYFIYMFDIKKIEKEVRK